MTELRCDHCGASFSLEEGARQSCPHCLRSHGIQPAGQQPTPTVDGPEGGRRHGRGALALALALALSFAGWMWLRPPADVGPETSLASVEELTKAGRAALAKEDLKAAYKAAAAASRLDPRAAAARELLGDVLLASRAQPEAMVEYLAAASLAEHGTLHTKIANLLLAEDRREEAAVHLRKALELEPEASWASAARAELQRLQPIPLPGDAGVGSVASDASEGVNDALGGSASGSKAAAGALSPAAAPVE